MLFEMEEELNKVGIMIQDENCDCNIVKSLTSAILDMYTSKSRQWMDDLSCCDYLRKVDTTLKLQETYLTSKIDSKLGRKVRKITMNALLKVHQKELLNKATGIDAIFRTVEIEPWQGM